MLLTRANLQVGIRLQGYQEKARRSRRFFYYSRSSLLFHSAHRGRECLALSKLTINSIFTVRELQIFCWTNAQNMSVRMDN